MEPKYIFTGTGRCGTGYVAALLTQAGYPCGHEEVFGPHTSAIASWAGIHGETSHRPKHESSWYALGTCSYVNVVHVTREPEDVVRSLCATRVMEDLTKGYGAIHARILPLLHSVRHPQDRAWCWLAFAYERFRYAETWDVSEPVGKLAEICGFDATLLEAAALVVPKDVNSRKRQMPEWWRGQWER